MTKVRPFLKWAGSKYHVLQHLLPSFPKAHRLIEPFAGSAAVFLNTNYPSTILGEQNRDLIALYTHLQQEGTSFIQYCKQFFIKENNHPEPYYDLRQRFNACDNSRLRAALFLYLNRHGYNGLCRYNLQGGFNVPFGRYDKPYFPLVEMQYFHTKSQQARFVHQSFEDTFKLAEPGDLIYCDPPYAPLSQTSNFTGYINKKFGDEQQIALAQLAIESAERGATVIISNHDTDFTRFHYRLSKMKSFSVKRYISCVPERRKPVKELIAVFDSKSGSHKTGLIDCPSS